MTVRIARGTPRPVASPIRWLLLVVSLLFEAAVSALLFVALLKIAEVAAVEL